MLCTIVLFVKGAGYSTKVLISIVTYPLSDNWRWMTRHELSEKVIFDEENTKSDSMFPNHSNKSP